MAFFDQIRATIEAKSPGEKFALFSDLYDRWSSGNIHRDEREGGDSPILFEDPSYLPFCTITLPELTAPRTGIGKKDGRAALLHSFAHIEYNAIDLALDAVYRFRSMPVEFISDWLEVAKEEIEHFQGIGGVLEELGIRYGDLPVHRGLFDVSMATSDLLSRMAIVPRHLEAVGLDVNPAFISRFSKMGDPQALRIESTLRIILRDEIDHVRKGDRWFRYECDRNGVGTSVYFDLLDKFKPSSYPLKNPPNREARLAAGFSLEEIEKLESGGD